MMNKRYLVDVMVEGSFQMESDNASVTRTATIPVTVVCGANVSKAGMEKILRDAIAFAVEGLHTTGYAFADGQATLASQQQEWTVIRSVEEFNGPIEPMTEPI